nr:glycerol-3-phosphate acyltransferase 1, mitochondrial-like isoform X1 [Ciona intestinalis]|eukprot:XP_026691429.1 glycerol-3-phosphate acyltransferase 1, mitochondrial-like isoform X1 [Ciona intestinalis]
MDRLNLPTKGQAPSKRISNYSMAATRKQERTDTSDEMSISTYKEQFHASSTYDDNIKRPDVGCGYWNMNEQIDEASSQLSLNAKQLLHESQKPFINLLHVPGVDERGILTRFMYYSYITCSRSVHHKYPDQMEMKKKVLDDESLHHAVQKTLCSTEHSHATAEGQVKLDQYLEKTLHDKAATMLADMTATVSSKALKFCGWLFLTLLRQLTSSVHLHPAQLDALRKLSEGDLPVLYLPLHYSHFDYILLSLICYHNEIRSPFVASGNNLHIPLFSYIMKRVGGFFIRRKIDSAGEKDLVYRAVLYSYVTELLKEKQSLEIFIEGTRTRSGLPNQPKTGLLAVAVEAVEKSQVDDIIIIPTCMSYEKLMEGNFDAELMGQTKIPETFLHSILTIGKMLCGFYGHIRVNFGAPQSLKKTLAEIRSSPACLSSKSQQSLPRSRSLYEQVTNKSMENKLSSSTPTCGVDLTSPDISLSNARLHYHTMSSPPSAQQLIEVEDAREERERRELVTLLAERVVYSSTKCKAIMSTNLVAYLLLHKWRGGVSMPQLVHSFRQLVTELLTSKYDVGFSGDFNEVVLHAVHLLGPRLVSLDCINSFQPTHSRSSSTASISRHSADSGYELEEGSASSTPVRVSDSPVTPAYSDVTIQLTPDEQSPKHEVPSNVLLTGTYMKLSESGIYEDDQLISVSTQEAAAAELNRKGRRKSKSDVCLFVKPVLEIPQVFELAYYGNALTPMYAMESIVALAVGATINFHFSVLEKQLDVFGKHSSSECVVLNTSEDFPHCVKTSFLRSSLLDKVMELIDLLQIDLILCDVTENLESVASNAIDSIISSGCLDADTCGVSAATRTSQLANDLCFENDFETTADQWLKVRNHFCFKIFKQLYVYAWVQSI